MNGVMPKELSALKSVETIPMKSESNLLPEFCEDGLKKLSTILLLLRNVDEKLQNEEERRINRHDWYHFARVLDHLLMIFFFLISIVSTIVLMLYRG